MSLQPPTVGQFVVGLVVGIFVGALVVMPVALLALTLVFSSLRAAQSYAFVTIYIAGVALGFWALWRARLRAGFLNGLLIGGAAGLLGLTALCNTVISALGQSR
jgi:hypothetical protein